MYLMYVDESGDGGASGSDYFILSGLIVNEYRWKRYLDQLIAFRKRMKALYGLNIRDEIHATEFINRPGRHSKIAKHDRLAILRHLMDEIEALPQVDVINVLVDKRGKPPTYDVFDNAWGDLIQRLENTLLAGNFKPSAGNWISRRGVPKKQAGMLIVDDTNGSKLQKKLRAMRYFNPIPSKFGGTRGSIPLKAVIEDPSMRNSAHSYFIQAVDCIAWMLKQQEDPSAYIKKQTGSGYFKRLNVSLCRFASPRDPQGIVRL